MTFHYAIATRKSVNKQLFTQIINYFSLLYSDMKICQNIINCFFNIHVMTHICLPSVKKTMK